MKHIIWQIFLTAVLSAQVLNVQGFELSTAAADSQPRPRGNSMVDLLVQQDSVLWGASGFGLNTTINDGRSWQIYNSGDYIGKGGISAMTTMNDSILWIATAFDTLAQGDNLTAGGGLSYSADFGASWTHVRQPIDSRDETEYSPTTTVIQNVTFDIATLDSTIWITSFGGGLRRSDDMGQSWQVVTTDGIPFSALQNLNHRAFSVITENGNIWVGTAQGISKSSDGGSTWRRFTHQNQEFPISGNFVVALAWQSFTQTIWAATIEATDAGEVRAVSKSSNGGETWEVMLEGTFPHNFAFDDSIVYVAADEGMFISDDGGADWYQLPPIYDNASGEEILTNVFYSAAVSERKGRKTVWIGSADGLASSSDRGNSWTVHRSYQPTGRAGVAKTYAYPSPFSPSRHGFVRFQYDIDKAGETIIDIYDFAMDKVATVREIESGSVAGRTDRSAKWDGLRDDGSPAASGVYFFRVNASGSVNWGKLVIIN